MAQITLDKIGSVNKNLNLKSKEELTDKLSCKMGTVLAAGAETIVVGSAIYNERQSVADSVAQLRQAIG